MIDSRTRERRFSLFSVSLPVRLSYLSLLLFSLIPLSEGLQTTYGGYPSYNASSYEFCGGYFDDGTECNSFLGGDFMTDVSEGGTASVSAEEVNLTSDGDNGVVDAQFKTIVPPLGQLFACDVQLVFYAGTSNIDTIGYVDIEDGDHLITLSQGTGFSAGAFDNIGGGSENTLFSGLSGNPNRNTGETVNFNGQETNITLFYNNSVDVVGISEAYIALNGVVLGSNLHEPDGGVLSSDHFNISFEVDHGTTKVGFKRLLCYNVTNGAPQRPDTGYPSLVIESPSPLESEVVSVLPVVYNVSASDDRSVSEVYAITNGTRSALTGSGSYAGTFDPLQTGTFTYYVIVNDTAGNVNQSDPITYQIDNVSPTITFIIPNGLNTSAVSPSDTMDIRGTNTQLINGSVRSSFLNGTTISTIQETGIFSSSFTFTNPISDLLSGKEDGLYAFEACFTDHADLTTCGSAQLTLQNPGPVVAEDGTTLSSFGVSNDGAYLSFGIVTLVLLFTSQMIYHVMRRSA